MHEDVLEDMKKLIAVSAVQLPLNYLQKHLYVSSWYIWAYIERKMIHLSCLSSDVWNFSWCFEVSKSCILRFLMEPLMICGTQFGNRLTYLLTYSMVQSLSWEANWFASQEIPRISWNPKVHYRTHPDCFVSRASIQHVSVSEQKFLQGGVVSTSPNPPSWRTTLRRLSATAYSIYSQLPSLSDAVPLSATWGLAIPWWQGPATDLEDRK